jgi:phage tail tape-measure protein
VFRQGRLKNRPVNQTRVSPDVAQIARRNETSVAQIARRNETSVAQIARRNETSVAQIARRNETSVAQIPKDFGISDAVFGGGLPRLMVNETKFTELV